MPIARMLNEQQSSFDPDAIKIITAAYDRAREALGLSDRADPLMELLATKILEAAQTGERDPLRIYQMALDSLGAAVPVYPGWPADDGSQSSH